MGDAIEDSGTRKTSLEKAVERPARSRTVAIAGLTGSVVAFAVCVGVVIEHLLTRDFVQVASWMAVSVIPLITGRMSRSYYRRLSTPATQRALPDQRVP